ncbi:MAG: pantoate--beta-alanine ligase [Mangrovibacterium sp.]
MHVIKELTPLKELINQQKENDKIIGFIPTMGALHTGHLSLINEADKTCDFVVVSIFVNPTQFNDPKDLEKYPRTLDADLALLEKTPCNLVFTPEVNTIYPEPDNSMFDLGSLATVMEGKFRPGHFHGVVQVVKRLFDIVEPRKAFFGQKDFQQVAIIKHMTKQLNLPVEIVSCPIIREKSGLALSSRNQLLSQEERKRATTIYQTIFWAKSQNDKLDIKTLKQAVIEQINVVDCLEVEYIEIADAETLQTVESWDDSPHIVLCATVYCGKVRLIDNIMLK